ncbi:hypothetical protein IV500_17015 [Paeniglutamicibacter antarcticus]|uniref:GAF domain-containing protein n=2 Tax=Arthrobacter terrae TaxID=2935737 RepID=A0A931CUC1_9MICC|nr:GAF domain-containing protein [Arthrobacter terrae]MBG0741076.1 hypothetical protein [Arthrobacter terrae]
MTASRNQITVEVPDLEGEDRWPEYAATVQEYGMRTILAVPFNLEGDAKAALNLSSAQVGKFDAHVQETVTRYTREVTTALQLGLRFAQHIDTASDLKTALKSRTITDLAVGIIMAQTGVARKQQLKFSNQHPAPGTSNSATSRPPSYSPSTRKPPTRISTTESMSRLRARRTTDSPRQWRAVRRLVKRI